MTFNSPWVFENWGNEVTNALTILNTGEGVKINVDADKVNPRPTVRGGGLDGTYVLEQFHFHWGKINTEGSEHTVNDKQYPVEMHFVMFKEGFADVTAAVADNKPGNLAVLGIWFELTTNAEEAKALNVITNALPSILTASETSTITNFKISDFFPSVNSFYRYTGSLTTPPCTQVVAWTLFSEKQKITQEQLNEFQKVAGKDKDGNAEAAPIGNWRVTQAVNNRILQFTSNTEGEIVAAGSESLHQMVTMTVVVIYSCLKLVTLIQI